MLRYNMLAWLSSAPNTKIRGSLFHCFDYPDYSYRQRPTDELDRCKIIQAIRVVSDLRIGGDWYNGLSYQPKPEPDFISAILSVWPISSYNSVFTKRSYILVDFCTAAFLQRSLKWFGVNDGCGGLYEILPTIQGNAGWSRTARNLHEPGRRRKLRRGI